MGVRRQTLPEQIADAYAERERQAAFVANFDAEEERRAEAKRKAEAQAETEELARTRLQEFLDAGLSETELRQQWPMILSEHFGRKNAERDAERQQMINAQRVF